MIRKNPKQVPVFNMSHFRQLAGKSSHVACEVDAMAPSVTKDSITEKEIRFLLENFDVVRFSDVYCFATYTGASESINDLLDRYLSLNSTSYEQRHMRRRRRRRVTSQVRHFIANNLIS